MKFCGAVCADQKQTQTGLMDKLKTLNPLQLVMWGIKMK